RVGGDRGVGDRALGNVRSVRDGRGGAAGGEVDVEVPARVAGAGLQLPGRVLQPQRAAAVRVYLDCLDTPDLGHRVSSGVARPWRAAPGRGRDLLPALRDRVAQ